MEHVPKVDSNLQINQSIENLNFKNIQNTAPTSSMKLPLLIILALTLLAAILTIILCLSLKGKKKRFFTVNIKGDDNNHSWESSYRKANSFINKLNRTERVNLLFGTQNMKMETLLFEESELPHLCVGQIDPFKNDKIDFKGMCLQDGPAGVRFARGNSISWQGSLNNAMTFDKKLMYDVGKAQGEENKEKGINVALAPCANMMRNPKGGRVWEAYGDDPYYTGVCASQVVKGIQDAGTIACLKHFVANDQETYRKASSSNMDMKTLMDIYAEPFYRSIHEADLGSIMMSYNAINNSYCFEDKFILTDVLRDILGFKGFTMSDWWSITNDDPINFNSGLDMNMPGGYGYGPFDEEKKYDYYGRNHSYWSDLEKYADEGKVSEDRINEAATRIIASMYKMDQMNNYPEVNIFKQTNTTERKNLQRKVATESQVLLKNDGILPLDTSKIKTIAVIGNDAFERDCLPDGLPQCSNETNAVINGHVPLGYGSGVTNFGYVITPLEGITKLAEEYNIKVSSSGKLEYIDEPINSTHTKHVNAIEDIDEGVKVANKSDVAIVFVKATSGEEFVVLNQSIGDRRDLDLWYEANELIEEVAKVNNNTIVVINAPATVNLPWLDKVKAVIFSGFPGSESGNAVADIIFGKENPSGHLPFVWGEEKDYSAQIPELENLTVINKTSGATYKDIYRYDTVDCYAKPDNEPGHDREQIDYTEGLYIGQRWFNKNNKKAIFPFGYGLSYTTFEYSDLNVSMNKDGLTAEFKVKNTGDRAGKAVPMLFLTFPENIGDYPPNIFKGFEKVEIQPGQTETVKILADDHALSYFNESQNKYVRVNEGKIKVYISDNADPSQFKLNSEIDANY
jgi:beta-glucosidase